MKKKGRWEIIDFKVVFPGEYANFMGHDKDGKQITFSRAIKCLATVMVYKPGVTEDVYSHNEIRPCCYFNSKRPVLRPICDDDNFLSTSSLDGLSGEFIVDFEDEDIEE